MGTEVGPACGPIWGTALRSRRVTCIYVEDAILYKSLYAKARANEYLL
jgi:hypothetical protein